jgi:hypothetical protein
MVAASRYYGQPPSGHQGNPLVRGVGACIRSVGDRIAPKTHPGGVRWVRCASGHADPGWVRAASGGWKSLHRLRRQSADVRGGADRSVNVGWAPPTMNTDGVQLVGGAHPTRCARRGFRGPHSGPYALTADPTRWDFPIGDSAFLGHQFLGASPAVAQGAFPGSGRGLTGGRRCSRSRARASVGAVVLVAGAGGKCVLGASVLGGITRRGPGGISRERARIDRWTALQPVARSGECRCRSTGGWGGRQGFLPCPSWPRCETARRR